MPVDITIRVPDERWAGAFWDWYLERLGNADFLVEVEHRGIADFEDVLVVRCRETWTIEHRVEE